MWKQSAFCQEKPNKSKDFAILGIRNIHFGERILFPKSGFVKGVYDEGN